MDANALAAAIQQAFNNAGPQAQPAGPFALAPAQAIQGALDYTQKAESAIFEKATVKLPSTFDLENPNVSVLIEELKNRATTFGWNNILDVQVDGATINILDGHGQLTLEQCHVWSDTYMNADDRLSQNDYQLYVCITESLNSETTKTVSNEKDLYLCPGPNDADPKKVSGLCLLKVLLRKAEADTRAIGAHIRANLGKLNQYIIDEAQHDIRKFNNYVREQLKALSSRGETSSDALYNVFLAYECVTDETFTRYIEQYKNRFDEGDNITIEDLMNKAELKYKTLLLAKKWNQQSKEAEQIIALQAKLESILTKARTKRQPTGTKRTETGSDTKKRSAPKKDANGKPIFEGKQAWRSAPPQEGEPNTKTVNGKEWKYCAHHGYWCAHTTEQCRDAPDNGLTDQETGLTAALASIGLEDIEDEAQHEQQ